MKNYIYNENCLDTMRNMDSNFVDLVLTSPPYDSLRKYNGFNFEFEEIARELYRILQPGGVIVWIVGDSTIDGSESLTSFKQALYFKEFGFNIHDTMIYQKFGFANPSNVRYHQIFEYMFVISKGKPKTFNPIKDRENKYQKARGGSLRSERPNAPRRKPVKATKFGMRFNIWSYPNGHTNMSMDPEVSEHPAPFPEALANDQIISWSNEGDTIYDPFMGSGTTAKMALLNKRFYIGSEISKEYCDLANQRLSRYIDN